MAEQTFNINDHVRIKLTDSGRKVLKAHYDSIELPPDFQRPSKSEDANGFSEWQLHEVMYIFGRSVYIGCETPFETNIKLDLAGIPDPSAVGELVEAAKGIVEFPSVWINDPTG